jgi:capsular polysaccharide export protein
MKSNATPPASCYALQQLAPHSRVLLLQGPLGHFFAHLANFLDTLGRQVFKVNFNGGDDLYFHHRPAEHYTGDVDTWAQWLENFITEKNVDAIVLFGQWRIYHRIAWHLANQMGISVYVFEEGYVRPDYITLEKHGVNGNSLISRNPQDYKGPANIKIPKPQPVGLRFSSMIYLAITYYLAAFFMQWRYPDYQHHRPLNPLTEGFMWIRSGWRKLLFPFFDYRKLKYLASPSVENKYFFVPLQVHNDSQIKSNSSFESVEEFIHEVVMSFAHHAPKESFLVMKHHPMDRGYKNYGQLLNTLSKQYDLGKRLIYIHDGHLPTLLKHSRGVVTINSTVGLSAIHHNAPTKILGDAVYDVPGLVSTQSLDDFWISPEAVNPHLFHRFKYELIRTTQLNASFYTRPSFHYLFASYWKYSITDKLPIYTTKNITNQKRKEENEKKGTSSQRTLQLSARPTSNTYTAIQSQQEYCLSE